MDPCDFGAAVRHLDDALAVESPLYREADRLGLVGVKAALLAAECDRRPLLAAAQLALSALHEVWLAGEVPRSVPAAVAALEAAGVRLLVG